MKLELVQANPFDLESQKGELTFETYEWITDD